MVALMGASLVWVPATPVLAQQHVTFPSVGDARAGQPDPQVDGYLFQPAAGTAPHPAVVFLHGCAGLFAASGAMTPREADWAARLTGLGYVILAVDSFGARHQGEECAPTAPHAVSVWHDRVHDAYGALRYLRRQSFVDADRIGVIGWSQGGMTVLDALNDATLFGFAGQRGFRGAIAFYPAGCDRNDWSIPGSGRLNWTTSAPLLVLFGGSDTWVNASACEQFVSAADRQGEPVSIHVYPGAFHDFDFPALARRELPAFTPIGSKVAPVVATDPAARADSISLVTKFLAVTLQR
jgi:dienelactone hydrolase